MSKDKKKKWISKRTITIGCTLACLVVVVGGILLFLKLRGPELLADGITIEEIERKSKEAMNKYDYALLDLVVQETKADEGQTTTEYILSSCRNSGEHSYMYGDTNGTELYQYWNKEAEDSECTIYIYDEQTKAWVQTSLKDEPISSDTWNMLTDLSNYEVMPGTYKWVNSDDDCYVLEMLGSSEEFYQIYEQVYVRASDFMPMGILSYAVSDMNYDRMKSDELFKDLNEDGVDEDITVEHPTYNELVQIYSVEFSDEDTKMFGVPEEYITEEEYAKRIAELEESEDNEE